METTNKKYISKNLIKRRIRFSVINLLYINSINENINFSKDDIKDLLVILRLCVLSNKIDYIFELYSETKENTQLINEIISKYSKERIIDEIDRLSLNIIQLAIYESIISKKTPLKVAISEAIEISKSLLDQGQVNFISGLLGTLYKEYDRN